LDYPIEKRADFSMLDPQSPNVRLHFQTALRPAHMGRTKS
jgi:hypothetical protein